MKIGIISDTHDNLAKIERAVNLFNRQRVGFVLHAGDFIAPFAIHKLNNLSSAWRGVFGNNDGEKKGLIRASGSRIQQGPLRLTLDNKKITLVHDINSLKLKKEKARLVIFGHTHLPEVRREGNRLLVNPGEAGGWLTGKSSVAIADLSRLTAKVFRI